MIIIAKDKDPKREEVLKKMVPMIHKLCNKLRHQYREKPIQFLPPRKLLLRTLQKRPFKRNMALMRIGHHHFRQWFIAVRDTIKKDETMLIYALLTHEIAHMGAIILKNYWGHGKVWQDIYDRLRDNKGEVVLGDLLVSVVIWGWLIFGIIRVLGKLI